MAEQKKYGTTTTPPPTTLPPAGPTPPVDPVENLNPQDVMTAAISHINGAINLLNTLTGNDNAVLAVGKLHGARVKLGA